MTTKSLGEIFSFAGKTTIVTGGAMGIGYGIVTRFIEAGANVVIADLDETTGVSKATSLGNRAFFIKTDVSNEDNVKQLIAKTVEKFGAIDVLVNNAGIFPSVPVLMMDLSLWEKIQAVNLRGVFLCSREAAKVMKEKGGGVIINIASIDALHPSMVGLAAYDASKHGVWGFTKNFALEVAPFNIRVNAIAPGSINTEGARKMSAGNTQAATNMEEMTKQFIARIPLKRMGEPDDIALPTLFLASDASRYMTGELIVVDGGVLLM